MSKRLIAVMSCFLLLTTACKAVGGGEEEEGGVSGDTLTFGAALSLTGQLSREGVLTREGYEFCQQTINDKGGVEVGDKTYQLDITYQDDKSAPDVAAQLVDQMNDDGVRFILGPYGSSSTEAASAVVERNDQLMISSAGADDKIYEKGYQNTFGVLSPASEYLATIVKAVADLAQPKPETVAILSADDGFSKTSAQGGVDEAESQGMEVVATEFFPEGATDVSTQLTKIKPMAPDLILGAVHLEEGIAIMKQAKELGVEPSGGFGETVAPPTPDFSDTLGESAEFVLGSSQWTPQSEGSDDFFGSAQDYAENFKAEFNRTPEYHNAEASAACLAFVMAIQDAGSLEVDAVRQALVDIDEQSFFGAIKFDDQGKNVYKPMQVIQIQDGEPVTVWPEGTAEMQWPASSFTEQ